MNDFMRIILPICRLRANLTFQYKSSDLKKYNRSDFE